jgi:hypothetical protein
MYWASEIEGPVVRQSRKKKGMFLKGETLRVARVTEESNSCHSMSMSE